MEVIKSNALKKITGAVVFIIGLCLSFTPVFSATRYWIGGASTAWNSNANWGTAPGTGAPASFPTTGDIAVFDGNAAANCSLTANISIATLSLLATYTRTLSQGAFSITISGSSTWAGGTFAGGTGALSNTGSFNLSGTSFVSTSGVITIGNTFSFTGGTFSHNNGSVNLSTSSYSITGAPLFNNLIVTSSGNTLTFVNSFTVAGDLTLSGSGGSSMNANIASGQTITVNGTLFYTGNRQVFVNTGVIDVKGNITVSNTSAATAGSGTLLIDGTGSQTLTGSGVFNQGVLPNIVINKPSGTLTLASYITADGPSWTYVAGTLSAGTSTLSFHQSVSFPANYTVSGTQSLNTVIFSGYFSTYIVNDSFTANDVTLDATNRCDITVNSDMTVNGNLLMTGSGYYNLNIGTVNVKGNIADNNTNTTQSGGTASFIINGTGNQTLTGTPLINQGALPPLIVSKPSGTLSLTGNVTLYSGFTWSAGAVDCGTSTCVFGNPSSLSQTVNVSPSGMSFHNVIFDQPDYEWTMIQSDLSIGGSMTITSGSGIQTNGHIISLGGNFICQNTTGSLVFNGATGCSMILNGSGLQTITMNNANAVFYDLTISNTAALTSNDDITLAGIVRVNHSVTFTSGRMLTTATHYLSLLSGAIVNTGNAASYVNGPMRYEMALNGSRALNFPIGEGGNWRPVILSLVHSNATSYTYVGQVTGSPAVALGYALPATIDHVSYQRYTQIDRLLTSSGAASNAGLSGNQTISMSYDANDIVNDYTNLTIAKTSTASGTPWIDIGGAASGNTAGTIVSTSSPSPFNTFSKFSLANKTGGNNPLPVELLNFIASPCDNNVCLNWSTVTENNSSFFTVEKSSNAIDFETVDKVKAAGKSNSLLHYSSEDHNPLNGVSYYRLKQTDADGTFNYYRLVSFNKTGIETISAFPNPSAPGRIALNGILQQEQVLVYGAAGEKILAQTVSPENPELDLSQLAEGIYFIATELSKATLKIILAR